ncbi:hypothetical protein, partial [Pedobacter suwonensis]
FLHNNFCFFQATTLGVNLKLAKGGQIYWYMQIMIGVKDPETYLSAFVKQFMSEGRKDSVLKVNYKDGEKGKYEIYIDFNQILKGLGEGKYQKFANKLNDFISQYIPSTTRKIITLNDNGSIALGELIRNKIASSYRDDMLPEVISQDGIGDLKEDLEGSIVVVGSCISNGKNLLYISRALRKFQKLRILYFVGITRTKNNKYLNQLKSNLKQGSYGGDTNSFHEIQKIFCENASIETSWLKEINFLSKFINFLNDKASPPKLALAYLIERKEMLQKSVGDDVKGLSLQLFYPRLVGGKIEELEIRKNFAFFDFDDYTKHVTQSDIYFTISNILNSLRNNDITAPNSDKPEKSLAQSPFVRNLLDPGNFDRFNDGIIQASILRAARPEELAYHVDQDLSLEMYGTFETLIKYHVQEQGEGLIEFLYALATGKISLVLSHLTSIIKLVRDVCKEELLLCFADIIEYKIILEPKEKQDAWENKLRENKKKEEIEPHVEVN